MATDARKPEGLFLIPGCGSRLKLALLFLHDDLALCPPGILEPLTECGDESLSFPVALGMRHQYADASHLVGLLPVHASGHVAAAPPRAALPRRVLNSRRCMCPPENTQAYHFATGRR